MKSGGSHEGHRKLYNKQMDVNPNVLIPYAVSQDGVLVSAREAEKGRPHRCPGCDAVVYRRSGGKTPHFFHMTRANCPAESTEHSAAKYLIAKCLECGIEYKNMMPKIVVKCDTCDTEKLDDLDVAYTRTSVEQTLPNGLRVDVALMSQELPVAAVEILHKHTVDWSKADKMPFRWIELKAEDVLANPYRWRPAQDFWNDKYMICPWRCDVCVRRVAQYQRFVNYLAGELKMNVISYGSVVTTVPYVCWHCPNYVLAYAWTRGYSYDEAYEMKNLDSNCSEEDPRPNTLVKWAGKDVNICTVCKNILWQFSDGPLEEAESLLIGSMGDTESDQIDSYMAYIMEKRDGWKFDLVDDFVNKRIGSLHEDKSNQNIASK